MRCFQKRAVVIQMYNCIPCLHTWTNAMSDKGWLSRQNLVYRKIVLEYLLRNWAESAFRRCTIYWMSFEAINAYWMNVVAKFHENLLFVLYPLNLNLRSELIYSLFIRLSNNTISLLKELHRIWEEFSVNILWFKRFKKHFHAYACKPHISNGKRVFSYWYTYVNIFSTRTMKKSILL